MRPALPILAAAIVAAAGCGKAPAPKRDAPPPPVTVALAASKTVPLQVRAVGTVKVVASVSIHPRVTGELKAVHFEDGEFVRKGQKLFTIDPSTYDAAVKQAEATLARDTAVWHGAEGELRRVERGGVGGVVAAAEIDAARTAVGSAKATVAADEAALGLAKLQLGFTTIASPIDGRTGAVLITAGNLVGPTDLSPLVVINQMAPIDVAFALPERQLPVVADALRRGPLRAEAELRGGGPAAVGRLNFIDNAVDPTTGTVQLKAEFPNDDQRLWPGQFVDVLLTVGERPDSVVVPAAAVQTGQQGSYVFVVKADGTAELRPVEVAFDADGEAVVAKGLAAGETVVVEGQLRVAPGAKVDVKGRPKPPPPSAAAGPDATAVGGAGN